MRNTKSAVVATALAAMVLAGNASAAAIDVTTVTAAITDALTPVGAIGLAVLGLLVGIKTYKWVRRAM